MRAIETNNFQSVAMLSGELQKLFPTAEDATAGLQQGSDDDTVIDPAENRLTRPGGFSAQRASELEHNKCLAELNQHRARVLLLQKEATHLKRQLEGYQADLAALQGRAPQQS